MDGTVNVLSVIRLEDKRIECTHRSDCGIRAEVAQLVEHLAVNRRCHRFKSYPFGCANRCS